MSPKNDHLIWIDLEMTGLNAEQDRIIEIATVITDSQLQVIATGPVLAIHQSESLMNAMGEWCQTTHTASGLCKRVKESTVSESQAEQLTLDFLAQYVAHNTSPMCGNSIWNDRLFLVKYMPKLEAFFHYRMVDVSTLKELAKRWRPDLYNSFVKETKHQALDDIHESIDELKFYRETFLVDKKI